MQTTHLLLPSLPNSLAGTAVVVLHNTFTVHMGLLGALYYIISCREPAHSLCIASFPGCFVGGAWVRGYLYVGMAVTGHWPWQSKAVAEWCLGGAQAPPHRVAFLPMGLHGVVLQCKKGMIEIHVFLKHRSPI